MSNIAEAIIEKCGGAQRVADWLGLRVAAVHRWKYPQERGGTGGLIPSFHQHALMDKARAAGVDLRPEDFFPQVEGSQESETPFTVAAQ